MESTINHSSIESYSGNLAQKLSDSFFNERDFISGKEILEFTPIPQINLFILREVFRIWKGEVKKLESSFFDYKSQEVKDALYKFLNKLSQHIQIGKNDFAPVLKEAITNTILLVFSPYDFYSKDILDAGLDPVSLGDLKESRKFLKVNGNLMDHLILKVEKASQTEISQAETQVLFDQVIQETNDEPVPHEPFLAEFSRLEPLQESMIYTEIRDEKSASISVNENYTAEQQTTLNEKLGDVPKSTVADIHQKKPIENIRESLSLNQRFMFVKELFKGDNDKFEHAVDTLENYGNFQEALDLVKNVLAEEYHWDMDSAEVRDLLEIIQRKYE